ncbi:MAG: ComEC/Rec2 family competence protein [Oscillospiraceae bacterium]|nr:ComEC/Rec2 family competence protein [Oscillospiraceae bacterium]
MVRKMAYVGFSFAAGLFFAHIFGSGITAAAAVFLFIAAAVMLIRDRKRFVTLIVCFISGAVGGIWYSCYDCFIYDKLLECNDKNITFEGSIIDIDSMGEDRKAYTVKGVINGKYHGSIILYTDSLIAKPDDVISFTGKASAFRNSYTFSTEDYNKSKGIFLAVNSPEYIVHTEHNGFSIRRTAWKYSNYLKDIIRDNTDGVYGEMLIAMLLGDKSGLDGTVKNMMYRAGYGHVMAVSGMHLTVIYSLISAVLNSISRFDKRQVFILTLVPVTLFCFMSGLSVSVMRAFIMLCIVNSAAFFRRSGDILNSLGIAALVLTVPMPFSISDTGLILSFAGVIGVGVIAPKAVKNAEAFYIKLRDNDRAKLPKAAKAVLSSYCAYLAIFPLSMLIFDEVSLIAPVTNILLVPLCSVALICTAFTALTGGIGIIAIPSLNAAQLFCRPVLAASQLISANEIFYLPMGNTAVKYLGAASVGLMLVLLLKSDIVRVCLIGTVSAAVCISSVHIIGISDRDKIKTAYLCGGDCSVIIVTVNGKAAVIDLSGESRSAADKYLKRNGIYDIDMIMLYDKASSALSSYLNGYSLYDTASYFLPTGSYLYTENTALEEKVFYYDEDKLIDCGYAEIHKDKKGISVKVEDYEIFAVTDGNESDVHNKKRFCTIADRNNTGTVNGSEYILLSEKGECSSSDGVIYDNCCIEFTFDDKQTRGRVIFNGSIN